jgi:hypothetical protein
MFNPSPGSQLHAHLTPDGLLAGKSFIDGAPNETVPAEWAAPAPRGHIPGMKAVKNVPAALAEDAAASDAQESPGSRVVVQYGDVFVHQEDVGRNGVQQLAEQDFVAHLCDWNTHRVEYRQDAGRLSTQIHSQDFRRLKPARRRGDYA